MTGVCYSPCVFSLRRSGIRVVVSYPELNLRLIIDDVILRVHAYSKVVGFMLLGMVGGVCACGNWGSINGYTKYILTKYILG